MRLFFFRSWGGIQSSSLRSSPCSIAKSYNFSWNSSLSHCSSLVPRYLNLRHPRSPLLLSQNQHRSFRDKKPFQQPCWGSPWWECCHCQWRGLPRIRHLIGTPQVWCWISKFLGRFEIWTSIFLFLMAPAGYILLLDRISFTRRLARTKIVISARANLLAEIHYFISCPFA